jgi:hypothetical protein
MSRELGSDRPGGGVENQQAFDGGRSGAKKNGLRFPEGR